jgi:hypothetical protein
MALRTFRIARAGELSCETYVRTQRGQTWTTLEQKSSFGLLASEELSQLKGEELSQLKGSDTENSLEP